jgi:imidazoleglycerol phosphate synthase glutamine amidotransferase subunit HisH
MCWPIGDRSTKNEFWFKRVRKVKARMTINFVLMVIYFVHSFKLGTTSPNSAYFLFEKYRRTIGAVNQTNKIIEE